MAEKRNCCNSHIFGVKFRSSISICVKKITFCNSANDISGLRNLSASYQKRMALRSSKETSKRAMNQFGCKVIILARPRRGDSVELEKLNRVSNDHLCKLIEEEPRLTYGSNESLMSFSDDDLFGRRFSTARYDSFHLRGKHSLFATFLSEFWQATDLFAVFLFPACIISTTFTFHNWVF